MLRFIAISLLLTLPLAAQTKVDLVRQVKGVLPVQFGGTGSTSPPPTFLTPGQNFAKHNTDYAWTRSPGTDLTSPGPQTVSLSSCPFGVFGTWPGPSYYPDPRLYYVRVANTGTLEAVKVMGGTCNGDGLPGTLQFTTVNTHPAGYTVTSASNGIIEAANAAAVTIVTGAPFQYKMQGGNVIIDPGINHAYAPVAFINNSQTIYFSGGASIECNFDDDCIYLGDPAKYQATNNLQLINPQGIAGIANGTHAFIVDFANNSRIQNVSTFIPSVPNATFGYIVEAVGDQSMTLDGLSIADGVRCDTIFCGAKVYAPGPFSGHAGTPYTGGDNAAVGFLSHIVSGNCGGNGIDWQSGNIVRISDSVIQGYKQFGIRWSLVKGGFGMMQLDNVYFESGCPQSGPNGPPQGLVGHAGIIGIGGKISIHGGEGPQGDFPLFANTGPTTSFYYVIATDGVNGQSNLLYAGTANTDGVTPVTISFNPIPGATAYTLLSNTTLYQTPFGTGNWLAVASTPSGTICTSLLCTMIDPQTRSSYVVVAPTYFPQIPLWGGSLIISNAAIVTSTSGTGTVQLDRNNLNLNSLVQVNTAGSAQETFDSERCILLPGSPVWQACTGQDQDKAATLMHGNLNGGGTNLKGRVNFMTSSGVNHITTWYDSNLGKTMGSASNRPSNDANDTYVGFDQAAGGPSSIGLAFGAPLSISFYIGNTGDNINWKARVQATGLAIASGTTNKVACYHADKTLGVCSTAPDATGSCTCN